MAGVSHHRQSPYLLLQPGHLLTDLVQPNADVSKLIHGDHASISASSLRSTGEDWVFGRSQVLRLYAEQLCGFAQRALPVPECHGHML